MIEYSLNGTWEMRAAEEADCIPASVPGSVYHDLLAAGGMEDPYWRDNELAALSLMERDYVYRRAFIVSDELYACGAIVLRCGGLDTLARITINGVLVGTADNMHRTWEFPVKEALRTGENEIEIRFSSPTRYIREAYEKSPADGARDAMVGFPLLRKAHCMFGWDWGPRLPDAGIWRDISLIGINTARITGVHIAQRHENGAVRLSIRTDIKYVSEGMADISVTVGAPGGAEWSANGTDCEIIIKDPQLWWPNGYGSQPLYTVCVDLRSADETIDRWERRIGLRTLTVHIQKDSWGESFCHRVNGVDIFAMGADYIPEDNLLPRVNPERTRRLLADAASAHFNIIRVWGGGYYPDDFFYDICDELGLIVWQDFMFACAVYNLNEDFEQNIRAEITDNVRRLRHHASLGLWCGNNEMEMFVDSGLWVSTPKQKADYIKMYEYIIPRIVRKEDPDTFYWPASPSSGGSFDAPNDPDRGDVHYWNVWHGELPFTDYRNHVFRYVSEFGFQSFPCMKTIESFTEPGERNAFSYVMEKHQRNASANGKIIAYLAQMYRYPQDLDTLAYASQLLQAQAIQYGVEHWRRNRGRCMGAVIWQLNDCWPVISWSSIDYFGRWKALHYYARRFFAPVLISCHEEGVLSQDTNVNAEPFELIKSARLNVSNETLAPFSGRVRWSLRRPDASVITEGQCDVSVPPLSALWLDGQDFSGQDTFRCYFSYRLECEGHRVGGGSVLFCPPKHFCFEDPALDISLNGGIITVTSQSYARSVEIQCDCDTVLEDNYFDMDAGSRQIRILRGNPASVKARSVYDIG